MEDLEAVVDHERVGQALQKLSHFAASRERAHRRLAEVLADSSLPWSDLLVVIEHLKGPPRGGRGRKAGKNPVYAVAWQTLLPQHEPTMGDALVLARRFPGIGQGGTDNSRARSFWNHRPRMEKQQVK